MYEGRELFPSPPVALVAVEVRFGHEPALASQEGIDRLLAGVRERFPLLSREEMQTITLTPGAAEQKQQTNWRALSENRTSSVTLSSESIVYETTDYRGGYEDFRTALQHVTEHLDEQLRYARIWRLGLRYIDEIRLPSHVSDSTGWADWLAPHLTAPAMSIGNDSVISYHGDASWTVGEDRAITLRWGTFDQPSVLSPTMTLSRPTHNQRGPIFVLDVDSYYQPALPPQYSSELAMALIDDLHDPTGSIFQNALTDRLRAQFRKEQE